MASQPTLPTTTRPDLRALVAGTFTLRFSTGLTGALLVYYLVSIAQQSGNVVDPLIVGAFAAIFFAAELILSAPFGVLSDRLGSHRLMQLGPIFGGVAVLITWGNTALATLGFARWLEGASTAASTPSTLRYLAEATDGDGAARARASSRFEAATIAGLGAGLAAAGLLWAALGRDAFFLNALIYAGSFLVFRFLVPALPAADDPTADEHAAGDRVPGWRRRAAVIRQSGVLALAPTWIAINAALGVWMSQSIFALVGKPNAAFADQLLMGGFGPVEVSVAIAIGLAVLFAGLGFWGGHFQQRRRTDLIAVGLGGGSVVAAAAAVLNHSQGQPVPVQALWAVAIAVGLFGLSAATPAALGLLADLSERFSAERGSVMGLYSVFLALGQIGGALAGGTAAQLDGIDGMLVATFGLLAIAVLPLAYLRRHERGFAECARCGGGDGPSRPMPNGDWRDLEQPESV